MTTVPGAVGVIGLRVPGVLAYRHLAIRLVSTACKMALEADGRVSASHDDPITAVGATAPTAPGDSSADESDFEAEVVSAFGEAFNNIAIHGYRGMSPGAVQIEVDWDDEKLVITSMDSGHAFNPDLVAAPDLDELHEHGMGLFIMRSCMDRIEYQPGPPNVLRLIKLRCRGEAALRAPAGSKDLVPTVPPSSGTVYDAGAGVPGPRAPADPSTRGSGVQRIPLGTWHQEHVDQIVESSRRR